MLRRGTSTSVVLQANFHTFGMLRSEGGVHMALSAWVLSLCESIMSKKLPNVPQENPRIVIRCATCTWVFRLAGSKGLSFIEQRASSPIDEERHSLVRDRSLFRTATLVIGAEKFSAEPTDHFSPEKDITPLPLCLHRTIDLMLTARIYELTCSCKRRS
jgi:hypothetical protein